jgi:hypothetical protein
VHSTDYFVINPIGTFDCIHRTASKIESFVKPGSRDDGKIVGIDRLVLDTKKLVDAPPLFRIKDQCRVYVLNETLAQEFKKRKFTNIELIELPHE